MLTDHCTCHVHECYFQLEFYRIRLASHGPCMKLCLSATYPVLNFCYLRHQRVSVLVAALAVG